MTDEEYFQKIENDNIALIKSGGRPDKTDKYGYYSYKGLKDKMKELAKEYPKLLKLETSQKRFDLPKPGDCEGEECETFIMTITNQSDDEDETKPQIYLSGEIHGDERIGPNAVIETAALLLEEYGKNPWITYLVNNRIIVITPMTNAQGYAGNHREEIWEKEALDPNRDFPYFVAQDDCLKTVTAKTVYKLFADHPFTLAITFHAGEHSITHPWGAGNHLQDKTSGKKLPTTNGYVDNAASTESPDEVSFEKVVSILKNAASFSQEKNLPVYVTGPISSVVYAVEGGMEDWGYSAGWENDAIKRENEEGLIPHQDSYELPIVDECKPKTYTKDPTFKSDSRIDQNHTATSLILIETSDDKCPRVEELGDRSKNSKCVLDYLDTAFYEGLDQDERPDCKQKDGHIPRNVRICLSLIDLAAPYVNIRSVQRNKDKNEVYIEWKVGGAVTVNKNQIIWLEKDDVEKLLDDDIFNKVETQDEDEFDRYSVSKKWQIKTRDAEKARKKLLEIFDQHSDQTKDKQDAGKAIWNFDEKNEQKVAQTSDMFSATIPVDDKDNKIAFMIISQVDQDFGDNIVQRDPYTEDGQTHFVRSRTNPKYYTKFDNVKTQLMSYYYVYSDIYVL